MKLNCLQTLIIGLSIFIISSCSHYYYAPNSSNTPLFREKNELSLNGQIVSGSFHEGIEVQGAYAVGKHTAIMANFFRASSDNNSSNIDNDENGKGTFGELGAGVFFPIKGSKLVFETFGGGGLGFVINDYGTSASKVSFNRWFVQPDLGLRTKYFDLIISGRLSMLNLKIEDINSAGNIDQNDWEDLQYVGEHKTSMLWEPGIAVRAGWNPIKIKLQLNRSYNLNNPDLEQDDVALSLGFNILLPTKKRKF